MLCAIREFVLPFEHNINEIRLYTDSQNIITLPSRRERLEGANFYSKKNKLLANHDVYREFFSMLDRVTFSLIKVAGHKPNCEKNDIDKIFSLVDRAARAAHT